MSNACAFCEVKESSSVGKWLACSVCVGCRDPQTALRGMCVDKGYARTFGLWMPGAPAQFRCNVCLASDSAKRRESVADEFKSRCDPASTCRDIFAACPRMVDLRRAAAAEIRSSLMRVKKRLPPSNASGLGDVLGQAGGSRRKAPRCC